GGDAHVGRGGQVVDDGAAVDPEPGAQLGDGDAVGPRGDPRDHGQRAADPVVGGRAAHGAASARYRSSHETISARRSGGSSTSACSRKVSTKERNADRLVTTTSATRPPSGCSWSTASPPRWRRSAGAWPGSTRR